MSESATSDPRRPSILYVATIAPTIGHFMSPYARYLVARGWRVDAAASGATTDPNLGRSFQQVHDLPLTRSIFDVRGMLRAGRALVRLLTSGRYDIVHVHTPIAAFVTRGAVARLPQGHRPAVVYTAHGFHFHSAGHPLANLAFLLAERIAGRWTDRLIVINQEDEQAARQHRIVPWSHLVRMPGVGLDVDWYDATGLDPGAIGGARIAAGGKPGDPLFVCVGELNRNKRTADVISAIACMRHPAARLLVIGEGAERPRLEVLAASLGVADRVCLAGRVDDVRPAVVAATALVHASRREGLNRSIMEALALGVPVVASTARGNTELVGTDAGMVVPTGDVAAIASAMDWMVEHPADAARMGRVGRARALAQYDIRRVIERHEALYRSLLPAERRAGGSRRVTRRVGGAR